MGEPEVSAKPFTSICVCTMVLALVAASMTTAFARADKFALPRSKKTMKAFGAGILSSFGELEYSVSGKPKYLPFDPYVAAVTPYPITTFQPTYFVANSFKEMKEEMQKYALTIDKPFTVKYNPHQKSIAQHSRNTDPR